ncbi:MAG: cob(I)yrinic acid a,c-diamide adenosyltransferase [bacterium]
MANRPHGLVIVNTGEGKGKSTAAFGLAVRAVGQGIRVFLIQFIKGTWNTGEAVALKRLGPELEVRTGLGDGFTWITQDPDQDRLTSREIWKIGREAILSGGYGMVILDEINVAMDLGHLDPEEVIGALRERDPGLHVVLTGRGVPKALIEHADLVSEMVPVKHPYEKGVKAQRGIEF